MSVHDFAEMYIIVPRTNCGILIQMDSHFTNQIQTLGKHLHTIDGIEVYFKM